MSARGSRTVVAFDVIRFVAALLVVLNHTRAMFFDSAENVNLGILGKVFYGMTALGHQSVIVFFVLSGFLVGGNTFEKVKSKRFSGTQYWIARLSRLWTVLLPALVLSFLVDLLTTNAFPTAFVVAHSDEVGGMFLRPFAEMMTWPNYLGSALFVNTLLVHDPGSASQLWSLAYEWWYYVLAGLVAHFWVSPKLTGKAVAVVIFAASVGFLAVFNPMILAYSLLWLMGAAGGAFPWICSRLAPGRHILRVAVVLVVLAGGGGMLPGLMGDLLIGLIVALTLMAESSKAIYSEEASRAERGIQYTADSTYTLYCIHLPLVALASAAFVGPARWQSVGLGGILFYAMTVALLVATAHALSFVTERRTVRVRRWAEAMFERNTA
jgi:peptidoglycan/LPS O-acetylase OafA/YrhL